MVFTSAGFMLMPQSQRLDAVYDTYLGQQARNPFGIGVGAAPSYTDAVYKAVIPNFLYKPAFGYPVNKDIPEIRRMGATPFVSMVKTTVCNEMAALDWNCIAREGIDVPDKILQKTEDFFYNPNRNDESQESILRTYVGDLLEIDAGLLVKVRNFKDEFLEYYVRDGGTFTKNPDIFGIMPEFRAYYQYGWLTGARPIPFNRNEVSYGMMNPRSDSIYGRSPVEVLLNVLQLLTYGVDSNLDYFRDNNIPKGVMQMIGAEKDDIEAFSKDWQEKLKQKDSAGNWHRYFHKMPIVNTDGQFVRIGFSNVELELIEQQKWFTKIVWACFNVTAEEMGFTEDSNKAVSKTQFAIIKRKLIKPLVKLIEYKYNTELINDLPWIKGKYENKVLFDFDKFDLVEELEKRKLFWGDLKNGLRTANEIRIKEIDLEEIEGGDELRKAGGGSPFGFQSTSEFGGTEEDETGLKAKPEDIFKDDQEKLLPDELKSKRAKDYKVKKKIQTKAVMGNPLVPQNFEEMANPKVVEKWVGKEINELRKTIKALILREGGKKTVSEIKAIDKAFTERIAGLFSLSNLKELFDGMVKANFSKGIEAVGEKLDMNFMPNQRAVDFLQSYTFGNVRDLEEEVRNDLRAELQRGILNGEGTRELSKRVDKVMDVGKNRADMIARTESNRAVNMGSLDGWKQSGLKGTKEWVAKIDNRTSQICKDLDGKKVGLNEKFDWRGQEFDAPPAHVSCRSVLIFKPE